MKRKENHTKKNGAMTVKNLSEEYARKYAQHKYAEARLRRQIERAKEKLDALQFPSWVENLIKPIADELLRHLPDRYYEILGPFGLGHTTSIHFYRNGVTNENMFDGNNCRSITFRPGEIKNGDLMIVDDSKNTGKYSEGTIGELNGFNHPTIDLDPNMKIADLLKYVHK